MPYAISTAEPPSRFGRSGVVGFVSLVALAAAVIAAMRGMEFSASGLSEALPRMARILAEMVPPATTRLPQVGAALLETFGMALIGTLLGAALSIPLAALMARGTAPVPVRAAVRGVVAVCRTVPDLVWAILFVSAVGLGPLAGTLAIAVDKVGFCARFFAEAVEEADRGPQEALRVLGAGRAGVLLAAVLPAVLPSWTNTALFGLEKAVRSSVVLGLVGAGGIGIELSVAMDLFRYDEAATVILAIFAMVVLVETASGALRRRMI